MLAPHDAIDDARRRFLFCSASTAGSLALASLLKKDGLAVTEESNPLAPKPPLRHAWLSTLTTDQRPTSP